jgi:hypothetical protein
VRPDDYAVGERYRCAHCGRPSSMMGHVFVENGLVNGEEFEAMVCARSITGAAPRRIGFACEPNHTCRD